MTLTSRNLQPYTHSVRARFNLHVDHQDRKPVRSPHATIAYKLEIGTPLVYDPTTAVWYVPDGAETTNAWEVTLRGFVAEEHTFESPGASADELVLVMLKGKISANDVPRKTDGSLSIYDADGGNELALATSAQLEAMLQGVAPGGGAVPSTTLRELGIYVTDLPKIA